MSFARSERMELYRVTIPKDDAWRVVETLGDMGAAHFINMNRDEQIQKLPYAARISLCDETERRLKFLLDTCGEMNVPIHKPDSPEKFQDNVQEITEEIGELTTTRGAMRRTMAT